MRRALAAAFGLALLVVTAGCAGKETVSPAPETVIGTIEQPTVAEGDPEAGKEVFAAQGCGACHTFEAAGSTATIGPNLDETLQDKDAQYIQQSIVNPNAVVAPGFQAGIMPQDYGQKLSEQELADLVAFLTPKS